MSMNSVPGRRAVRRAVLAEQRLLDLRRVGDAGDHDRARARDAGRIAAVARAERDEPLDRLAVAVRAHGELESGAQQRRRHRLAHHADTDEPDFVCHTSRTRTARGTRRACAPNVPCHAADRSAFVRLSRPLFLYGGFAGVALGAAVAALVGTGRSTSRPTRGRRRW